VYRHLRTPWGETFQFEPDSRALIPPEVTARIHQLNSLDEELWKQAHALLEVGGGCAGAELAAASKASLAVAVNPEGC
jgi:hypothetical protein